MHAFRAANQAVIELYQQYGWIAREAHRKFLS